MVLVLNKDSVTVASTSYVPAILLNTFYFSLTNNRKFLLPLSLLIVISLMPYANAQNNLTGSQMNMTGSR